LTPLGRRTHQDRHGEGAPKRGRGSVLANAEHGGKTALTLVVPATSVIVPRAGMSMCWARQSPGGYVMAGGRQVECRPGSGVERGNGSAANTAGCRVIRRNPDGTILDFPLSYNAIAKGTQAPLMLEAQDIVYVPMSKVKATFSTASSILSSRLGSDYHALTTLAAHNRSGWMRLLTGVRAGCSPTSQWSAEPTS